jgi:hypothetical protein
LVDEIDEIEDRGEAASLFCFVSFLPQPGLPRFQDDFRPNGPAHWARIGHFFLLNKNAYKAKFAPRKTPDLGLLIDEIF